VLLLLDMIDLALLTRTLDQAGEIDNYIRSVNFLTHHKYQIHLLGRSKGKSTLASIIAIKIYHPRRQVTNVKAPAASSHFAAIAKLPLAVWKNVPASRPKAGTSVKKMRKKTRLVRMEQMR
jgi:hypothetical protein